MKNAMIFHGTSGNPDKFWIPWLKDMLEKDGYEVWVPQLPEPDTPDLKIQLPFVLKNGKFNNETVIVGHSAGNPLIISVLEKIDIRIKGAVLVAGFIKNLTKVNKDAILQDKYDFEKIKNNVESLFFINSDNDPWGCDDKAGREMFNKLGGTLVIRHGDGHMGSDRFNQPYKTFPLLHKIIQSF